MKKNIIIVTTGRSGSSWLENCFVHELKYNAIRISDSELNEDDRLKLKDLDLNQRIDFLSAQPSPWVCKIIIDDWDHLPLNTIKSKTNAQLVWVWRRDLIDLFLSYAMGLMTHVFNTSDINGDYHTPDTIELSEFELNDFKHMIENRDNHYHWYHDFFDHTLEYSRMFSNNPWGFKKNDALGKLNAYTNNHRKQAKKLLRKIGLL